MTSAGEGDLLLLRVDSVGAIRYVKSFGDATANDIGGLAVDASDNVYLASHGSGSVDFGGGALTSVGDADVFVARLDGSGAHGWSRRFGDEGAQHVSALALGAGGGLLIAGHFTGVIDLGNGALAAQGPHDIFVGRLAP
ncbi:MAG: hypothetical protein AB1938_24055 [Myxococcota bacterium]